MIVFTWMTAFAVAAPTTPTGDSASDTATVVTDTGGTTTPDDTGTAGDTGTDPEPPADDTAVADTAAPTGSSAASMAGEVGGCHCNAGSYRYSGAAWILLCLTVVRRRR